ncbi:MAG: hypothetical protein JWM78_296 [Verrucomicrobiaceae bacterium]|nr:hypothetical protein [Verrucomicrobiaceae bacterium]
MAEKMERDWKAEIHAQQELGERQRITLKDALENYVNSKIDTKGYGYEKQNTNILNQNSLPIYSSMKFAIGT